MPHPYRRAVVDALPVMLFYVTFGTLFGLLARHSGWSPLAICASSAVVYSGAAQFALVGLLHAGSGAGALLTTLAILSVRHLTFTTAFLPWLSMLRQPVKTLAAFGLTDESFGLAAARRAEGERDLRYLLGVEVCLWPAWQVGTWIGVLISPWVRAVEGGVGPAIAFPALFVGLAAPLARGPFLRVALWAGVGAWVLGLWLPSGFALLGAVLAAPLLAKQRGEPRGRPV